MVIYLYRWRHFQASGTVKLMVHINGTYRARWNETLGFCMCLLYFFFENNIIIEYLYLNICTVRPAYPLTVNKLYSL